MGTAAEEQETESWDKAAESWAGISLAAVRGEQCC